MSDLRNSDLFNNPTDGVDELSTQYNSTIAGLIDSHAQLSLVLSSSDPRHRGTTVSYQMRSDNSGELKGGGDRHVYKCIETFTRVCETCTKNS